MSGITTSAQKTGLRVESHVVRAVICLTIAVVCTAVVLSRFKLGIDKWFLSLNWLALFAAVMTFWGILIVLPHRFPKRDKWLWEESPSPVPLEYSLSVVVFAYWGALAIVTGLLVWMAFGQGCAPTTRPYALMGILGVAVVPPGLYHLSAALNSLIHRAFPTVQPQSWLTKQDDAQRAILNGRGRFTILLVGTLTVGLIQGMVVLTGGHSTSFFTVLLVTSAYVAGLASERPAYLLLVASLGFCAAAFTQIIGNETPPNSNCYSWAHLIMLGISMAVGVIVDLCRSAIARRNAAIQSRT